MELDGVDVSACAAPLHICKARSVDSWYHRITIYFLVSCFCKPSTEQHHQGQSVELRQCQTNQDNALSQCSTKDLYSNKEIRESLCRVSEKRGHKTSVQGFAICDESNGTKNSQGLGCNFSDGAACHSGYQFRCKHCASNGGANLNAADKGGGRTGLNLHLILVILFSTNKLKPEKT